MKTKAEHTKMYVQLQMAKVNIMLYIFYHNKKRC